MRRPDPLGTARSWVTWALAYGFTRTAITQGARRGDLLARLEVDPALRADPIAAYDEVRAMGPVVHNKLLAATAHHAVATEILRSDAFGVGGGHGELPRPLQWLLGKTSDPYARGPVEPPSMLATDPPDHTRYRRLVSRAFTARAVSGLEDRIEDTARRLLDGLAAEAGDGGGELDLISRYAALLPVAVIADLLGVPDDVHADLLRWGDGAAVTLDPALTWTQYRSAERDVRQLHAWFSKHVTALRNDPGEDLLSRLAVLEGEDALTEIELHATGLLVLGAGFETTVNLIGNAVARLSEHPDQLDVLREDPTLWGNAVDEVLRHDSPVQVTMRLAQRDVDVSGVGVKEGTAVLAFLGGANRDPAVFEDPHAFDVRRGERRRPPGLLLGGPLLPRGEPGPPRGRGRAATALRAVPRPGGERPRRQARHPRAPRVRAPAGDPPVGSACRALV